MQKFFLFIVLILGLGLAALGLIALVNESAAKAETARGNAEAQIIHAEGQAALNRAQAASMVMTAAVPWGVLFILGLLGLAVVALCLVIVTRRPAVTPPVVLMLPPQPEISVLPPPGQEQRRWPPALAWVSGLLPSSEAVLLPARTDVRQDARRDKAIA
jgi:hypothetical protein